MSTPDPRVAQYQRILATLHASVNNHLSASNHANSRVNAMQPTSYEHHTQQLENLIRQSTNMERNKNDPYGDGDQSRINQDRPAAQHLMDVWGNGGNFDPITPQNAHYLSDFIKACFFGDETNVARMINEARAREQKDDSNLNPSQPGVAAPLKSTSPLFQLLEKRETVIRMNGLIACICGARMMGKGFIPREKESKAKHLAVAKLLIEAGTRVNIHDVAGYTPIHHCTTAQATGISISIGQLLVTYGADVNRRNRFGCVALFEPIMASRLDCLKFLIESGANPTLSDENGTIPIQLATTLPKCMQLLSIHAKRSALVGKRVKLCNIEKQQQPVHGEGQSSQSTNLAGIVGRCYRWDSSKDRYYVCFEDEPGREIIVKMNQMELVPSEQDLKPKCQATTCDQIGAHRCAKCLDVSYCSRECQRSHWPKHKLTCRVASSSMIPVGAAGDESKRELTIASWGEATSDRVKPFDGDLQVRDQPGRSQAAGQDFIVKIQLPLADVAQDMMVYNQDKSFLKMLPATDPSYATLRNIIKSQGVNGVSGYFRVVIRDFGIVAIQPKIQPPQPW